MRRFVLLVFLACSFTAVSAQNRLQALEEVEMIKERGKVLETVILQPDKQDADTAAKEQVNIFRILPREKYDRGVLPTRGGGAYYSFIKKSHSYNDTPQIELQQNNLSVGFYGANYGFITDLGEIPLSEISRESRTVRFLINYQPPKDEQKARSEFYKIERGFEEDGLIYKNYIAAVVGNSYLLRAVSYDEADVLVALQVHRRDADGSLIIFWKLIENFEKPILTGNQ